VSASIETIIANSRRLVYVLDKAGLVGEYKSLLRQMSFKDGVQEMVRRHPELSCELDVEAHSLVNPQRMR